MPKSEVNSRATVIEPIGGEPWVKLANGEELAAWRHQDEVAYNQANRQAEKYRFFVKAFDYIKDNRLRGDYHEFGCHRVRTFRMALTEARRHALDRMNFFAYDSFEGLPTTTSNPAHDIWKNPGALTTSEEEFLRIVREHGIFTDRVKAIKGFYAETLTRDLQHQLLDQYDRIALANIDCDLYESAVPVFRFIEPLLQEGSLIYIDDLFVGYRGTPARGVARAFLEFQQYSRFKFIQHMQVGWWGRSYIAYIDSDSPSGVL